MDCLSRLFGRALVLCLACAGAVLGVAAAAGATDKIPRPPGAIDNRGYELVSQADKHSSQVLIVTPPSTDGTRILYDAIGSVEGSVSGARPQLLATRTPAGWTSRDTLPPPSQWPGENYVTAVASSDVTSAVMSSYDGLGTAAPNVTLLRLPLNNTQALLHAFPTYFGVTGVEAVASDDLSHVLANVPEAIDASHQPGTRNVYDFGSGTPVLVSAMPLTNAAPTCGVPVTTLPPGFATPTSSASQHWVSTNGAHAFFLSRGDNAPACNASPRQLYTRDLVAGSTTLISGPPVGTDTDFGIGLFLQATPDGSLATYLTGTSLDPTDDVDGDSTDQDIYQWTADGGNVCVTCAVPHADVSTFFQRAAVSEDGSHIYFGSTGQYAGAPAAGSDFSPNLYVWHDDEVHFVAQASNVVDLPIQGGDVTPDGHVLIFESNEPGLNAASGSDNGGTMQVYRYDDSAHSITCVSCPAGGPATADVEPSLAVTRQPVPANIHAVTDDGNTVVFVGYDALVPEDVNQNADIYEWHSGQVRLITSGLVHYKKLLPEVVTLSPTGRDLIFKDTARLTTQAQDDSVKLYDARIDGGFEPVPVPKAPCFDDQCQGASPDAPNLIDPGSLSLRGGGNLKPASAPRFSFSRLNAAQRARLARTGTATLRVKVNRAGRISVLAQAKVGKRIRKVAGASRSARKAGTVVLTLHLSGRARAQLAAVGKLHVVLAVRFSKVPTATRMTLSLKATADGR